MRGLPLAPESRREKTGQQRMLPKGELCSRSPRSTPGQPEWEAAFLGPSGGRGQGHVHKMAAHSNGRALALGLRAKRSSSVGPPGSPRLQV